MTRPRCDKGFPRATTRDTTALYHNCMTVCAHYGLTELSTAMAWYSACIDHGKSARCYAAIVRSLREDRA